MKRIPQRWSTIVKRLRSSRTYLAWGKLWIQLNLLDKRSLRMINWFVWLGTSSPKQGAQSTKKTISTPKRARGSRCSPYFRMLRLTVLGISFHQDQLECAGMKVVLYQKLMRIRSNGSILRKKRRVMRLLSNHLNLKLTQGTCSKIATIQWWRPGSSTLQK